MNRFLFLVTLILAVLFPALASAQSGDASWSNNYKRTIINETVTLRTGPGMIAGITVGVVGTTSSIILYDNTSASGAVIGNFTTTALQTWLLTARFTTGLTYVTSGAAAADISIYYK